MQYLKKRISQMESKADNLGLAKIFENLFNTQCLGSAVLAINAASAATWKMTNPAALPYLVNGVSFSKTAATAQAVPTAITWAAVASTFNAGGFLIGLDSAGTVSTYPTNVSASTVSAAVALQQVVWPSVPENVCVIGGLIIQNSAANVAFTGATTLLDAANISVLYFNTTGPFFPTAPL